MELTTNTEIDSLLLHIAIRTRIPKIQSVHAPLINTVRPDVPWGFIEIVDMLTDDLIIMCRTTIEEGYHKVQGKSEMRKHFGYKRYDRLKNAALAAREDLRKLDQRIDDLLDQQKMTDAILLSLNL